jgi:glycosyltransferase involved in cell wall biosynthesis
LVTTINQSIAEEMVHRYGIPTPEVILNAPAAPARSAVQDRALLRRELQISPQQRILLYQGAFSRYRNLEDLIAAMAEVQNTNIVLVMMGPSVGRREDLEAIAREDGTLGRRVLFHDAVPQEVLLSYTSGAEIGIVPYPAVDLNSRYCAPNKLFEFIVAGVPILANDLPELRKFVHDTGFGQVYQLEGSAAIARAIDLMFRSDLQPYRERLAARRQEFTWAAQGEKLVALYEPLAAEAAIHAGAWRARDHKEKSTPLQQNVAE